MSIRRGVREVLAELRQALGTDDAALTRLFTAGGGPAAAVGQDGERRDDGPGDLAALLRPGAAPSCPTRARG